MRLAWFTPLPPVRSGVAAYSAEVLPWLATEHEIDVFLDVATTPLAADTVRAIHAGGLDTPYRALSAHDFVWLNLQRPYDLIVYQLGNAACHEYMWAYLVRHPGLAVLHDGELHHARAHQLLERKRDTDYRRELRHSHPDASPGIAGLVINGLATTLLYLYPLIGAVAETARGIAVHNEWLAGDLRERFPETVVQTIRMGVPDPRRAPDLAPNAAAPDSVRRKHGIAPDAVVFAAFGGVTPEKRIAPTLRAFSAMIERQPRSHLLLVGRAVSHYDAAAEAERLGIRDRVTLTGYVDDRELPRYLDATDVALCLRWPSSRETSGSWLRALAAGKPTIITDLVQTATLPALDPRTWDHAGPVNRTNAPIAVSIDILDEEHSLTLAMERLAIDRALRTALGGAAHAYWARTHTMEHMRDDYRTAMGVARETPPRYGTALPAHLVRDGTERATDVLEPFGVSVDFLSESE
jgi:glycosyltransferase involved in cell wall biosynthesis